MPFVNITLDVKTYFHHYNTDWTKMNEYSGLRNRSQTMSEDRNNNDEEYEHEQEVEESDADND